MPKRIIILFPTRTEALPLLETGCTEEVEICGVGMAETAAATLAAITKYSPDIIILAGIAGYYPGSSLKTGDVVMVSSECIADLGAMRANGFEKLYQKQYDCPYCRFEEFKKVRSNTVNIAAAPFIETADIENMEGSAFFSVCLAAGVEFMELRAISNVVGAPPSEWDIPLATDSLAKQLRRLLELLG